MSDKIIEVSLAILDRDNKFLMQLRDDDPNILYPGHWGLFGGHLEPGETPEECVVREIKEEIGYTIINLQKFSAYADERLIIDAASNLPVRKLQVLRHVYYAPLLAPIEQLVLEEGFDLALISPEEIYTKECYSVKASQKKPLVPAVYSILLDFFEFELKKNA